jgi:hypothetical protein
MGSGRGTTPRTGSGAAIWLYDSGGTDGTASMKAVINNPMLDIRAPKPPEHFMGCFTVRGGTGTQYYTYKGTGTRPWDIPNDPTLYAYWEGPAVPLIYTVVYDKNAQDRPRRHAVQHLLHGR